MEFQQSSWGQQNEHNMLSGCYPEKLCKLSVSEKRFYFSINILKVGKPIIKISSGELDIPNDT